MRKVALREFVLHLEGGAMKSLIQSIPISTWHNGDQRDFCVNRKELPKRSFIRNAWICISLFIETCDHMTALIVAA